MKKGVLIAIIGIVLIILIGLVLNFYQKDSQTESLKDTEKTEPQKTEPEPTKKPKTVTCSQPINVIEGYWADPDISQLSGGKYRIYYDCRGECSFLDKGIHSSISYDGFKWTKESARRLTEGKHPNILEIGDGIIRLYLTKEDESGIDVVISYDGISFAGEESDADLGSKILGLILGVSGKEVVLEKGNSGENDDRGVSSPSVIKTDTGYRMYYVGKRADSSSILSASSPDRVTWTKEGIRIDGTKAPFNREIDGLYIIKDDNKFVLYFSSNQGIYRVYSEDGLTFNTDELELVLESDFPSNPYVMKQGEKNIIYYNVHGEGIYRIECN